MTQTLQAEKIAQAIPLLAEGVAVEQQAGVTRLASEPFKRGPIRRWLAKIFKLPNRISVELDDIGSWVVHRLDGRNLQDLAHSLADDWKLTRREAEASVTVFIRALMRRRLVRLEWTQGAPL